MKVVFVLFVCDYTVSLGCVLERGELDVCCSKQTRPPGRDLLIFKVLLILDDRGSDIIAKNKLDMRTGFAPTKFSQIHDVLVRINTKT